MKYAARRILRVGAGVMLALIGAVVAVAGLGEAAVETGDAWGAAYVRRDAASLPIVDAALVLGTSPYGQRGQKYRTLSWRLSAAFELWSAGKARYLIVSGIHFGPDYDESTIMRDGLIGLGVPAEFVYRDPWGWRTWDQVVRARDVFGQVRLLIVSQPDHLARAVFLARHVGIEAWGFAAEGSAYIGLRGGIMRRLSMLRADYDIVAGTPARTDGRRVTIGADPPI